MAIGDSIAVIGLLRNLLKWDELEPLQVDAKWVETAQDKGVIPADQTYVWSDVDKAETRELAGTHEYVWVVDKMKRTRRKVFWSGDNVLMAKK